MVDKFLMENFFCSFSSLVKLQLGSGAIKLFTTGIHLIRNKLGVCNGQSLTPSDPYYKSFTIVIYDGNVSGQYYKL
jgi:hypothetical protein